MLVLEYFRGDDTQSKIVDMQHKMYDYTWTHMRVELSLLYLYNPFAELYYSYQEIYAMERNAQLDHRWLQHPHDFLAAVFRYKFQQGEFERQLFELSENELIEYHKSKFSDIVFLFKIDITRWYLTKRWLDFISSAMRKHLSLSREMANAIYKYNLKQQNLPKIWEASLKTTDIIMELYPEVPWTIFQRKKQADH
jgi:hypothetical protein